MADLDTLRWGDAKQIVFAGTGGRQLPLGATFQLVAARWRWPLLWGVRIVIVPALDAGETGTFVVDVQVTLGSGQNSMTAHFTYTIAPTAGVYPICVNDFLEIPASDIQVTATINGNPSVAGTVNESLQVGVFVAPQTEPHATTRMYEAMVEQAPEAKRFMDGQIGFQDEALRYQRR